VVGDSRTHKTLSETSTLHIFFWYCYLGCHNFGWWVFIIIMLCGFIAIPPQRCRHAVLFLLHASSFLLLYLRLEMIVIVFNEVHMTSV
jgi:hypothetical protein